MNVEALFEKMPCLSEKTLNEETATVGALKGSLKRWRCLRDAALMKSLCIWRNS